MNLYGIEISHIVELGTNFATTGAIKAVEVVADEVFDYVVAVAILIQETSGGTP